MSGRLRHLRYAWHNPTDMFATRYGSNKLRVWTAFYYVIYHTAFVVMFFIGVARVMQGFLGVDFIVGLLLMAAIIIIYTVVGGYYAVAWSNVIQFLLMFFTVAVVGLYGLNLAGGFEAMNNALYNIDPRLLDAEGALPLYRSLPNAMSVAFSIVTGAYYLRMVWAVRDRRAAKSLFGFAAPIMLIFFVLMIFIGTSARVVLGEGLTNAELIFTDMVKLLPAALGGIVVAGIIAAAQSSSDTMLISTGMLVANDMFALARPKTAEKHMIKFARIITLIVGIASVILAASQWGMLEIYYFIITANASTLFPALVLSLYWKRASETGILIGSLFGFFSVIIYQFIWRWDLGMFTHPTFSIMPIVFIISIVISLYTRKAPDASIKKFFG
jgi:Na+/proline symporter